QACLLVMPLRIPRPGLTPAAHDRSCRGLVKGGDGSLDDTAAQTDVALIEHHGLPRRHRSLRGIKTDQPASISRLDDAILIRLAVTNLGGHSQLPIKLQWIDPVDVRAFQRAGKQPRVIVALAD